MANSVKRSCGKDMVTHTRQFTRFLKEQLNQAEYYPPFNQYRYMVALMLYAKAIVTSEVVLALVDGGFWEEAFGFTRTLIDIFFSLRYIANKDTEERAKRFYNFFAKDTEVWLNVIHEYWPQNLPITDARLPKTLKIAHGYRDPHKWSGTTVREMAEEPDTVELDAKGKPAKHDFAYRAVYRWTSHFVHPTIVSLQEYVVQAGNDVFTVHAGDTGIDYGRMATYNVASFLAMVMASFYRCMGDPQPSRIGKYANGLMQHLTYRH